MLDRDELAARELCIAYAMLDGRWRDAAREIVALSALAPVAPASGAPAPLPGAPLAAPSPSLADATKPARIVVYPDKLDGNKPALTFGKTYDVIRWDDSDVAPRRYPVVICDLGHEYRLTETKWEATPSPAARTAAWVPSVGDVVALTNDDVTGGQRPCHDSFGARLYRVVKDQVGDDGCLECVRVDGRDTTSPCWISPGAMRPATSSERAAAGLPVDESATKPVDREGLIAAMEIAARKSCGDVGDQRSMTQVHADAAIAFMAKAPAFDEAKEREAAVAAYRAGDDGCVDPEGTQYPACRDSFRNGWLARARVAAKGGAS